MKANSPAPYQAEVLTQCGRASLPDAGLFDALIVKMKGHSSVAVSFEAKSPERKKSRC
jgi:hypothetical protein